MYAATTCRGSKKRVPDEKKNHNIITFYRTKKTKKKITILLTASPYNNTAEYSGSGICRGPYECDGFNLKKRKTKKKFTQSPNVIEKVIFYRYRSRRAFEYYSAAVPTACLGVGGRGGG